MHLTFKEAVAWSLSGVQDQACKTDEDESAIMQAGSNGESEKRPEVDGEAQGGQTGSAERVCDNSTMCI
jgi:hypothetical protein